MHGQTLPSTGFAGSTATPGGGLVHTATAKLARAHLIELRYIICIWEVISVACLECLEAVADFATDLLVTSSTQSFSAI